MKQCCFIDVRCLRCWPNIKTLFQCIMFVGRAQYTTIILHTLFSSRPECTGSTRLVHCTTVLSLINAPPPPPNKRASHCFLSSPFARKSKNTCQLASQLKFVSLQNRQLAVNTNTKCLFDRPSARTKLYNTIQC